jgi:hypothetical protein
VIYFLAFVGWLIYFVTLSFQAVEHRSVWEFVVGIMLCAPMILIFARKVYNNEG